MIKRLSIAAGLLCAFALSAATQAQPREPQDLVRAFYAEPNLYLSPARSSSYLARDLDVALKTPARPDEVGAIDFDYRYGAQDLEVSGLELLQEVDNDQARVVAVFKNFGKPESVDWTLCRRSDGDWRIADAASNTGRDPWDLRVMLRLPADRIRC